VGNHASVLVIDPEFLTVLRVLPTTNGLRSRMPMTENVQLSDHSPTSSHMIYDDLDHRLNVIAAEMVRVRLPATGQVTIIVGAAVDDVYHQET
jgi:hypothetical protein